MLIPERALPELLAELQSPLNASPQQQQQHGDEASTAATGSSRAKSGAADAQRGSLHDIMAGLRK